ncbi:MAG: YidC/Oxa1 family membrane protein insertase, partial [Patescibacteria group bacterium]
VENRSNPKKKLQELQPKIKELQSKYKNDKEKQSRALMELYKENKANPLSGCLPLIVQLVFLIAIYRVLFNISSNGFLVDDGSLYSWVSSPGKINEMFLGIINLAAHFDWRNITLASLPHLLLVLGAAGAQFFQSKKLMQKSVSSQEDGKNEDFSQIMQKQMLYLGPILTLFIGLKFPAGLALYWLVSTLFMIIQQEIIMKKKEKNS